MVAKVVEAVVLLLPPQRRLLQPVLASLLLEALLQPAVLRVSLAEERRAAAEGAAGALPWWAEGSTSSSVRLQRCVIKLFSLQQLRWRPEEGCYPRAAPGQAWWTVLVAEEEWATRKQREVD